MRTTFILCALFGAAFASAAEPTANSAPPTAAASPTAASTPTAAATAPTTDEGTATPSTLTPAQIAKLTKGYKKLRKDEQDYYCIVDQEVGTRFTKRKCYLLDELVAMETSRAENRVWMDRYQSQRPLKGE